MKNLKKTFLLLLAMVTLFSCAKEYDDSELRDRIVSLETWQKTVNEQIVALQGLVSALESKDYVTSVTELADKSGYVISFSKSGSVTIKHGQTGADGKTPVMSVKKDTDGKYYWTLDGEYIIIEGNKIPTVGDNGQTPHIGTNGNWWIGTTDTTIKATGNKGDTGAQGDKGEQGDAGAQGDKGEQGDAIFAKDGIDLTDPDNVTFTLADGNKITLPRTNSVIIGFDSYEVVDVIIGMGCPDIAVIMPDAETYTSIMAKIESNGGTGTDIKTKASESPWGAEIIKGADNKVSIRVTPAADAQDGSVAILTVSVVTKTGALVSASRTIKITSPTPITPTGDTYTITSASQLSWVIGQMSTTNFTKDKVFELQSDLDLTGYQWKPIGSQDDGTNIQFLGTFDGKGHTVKGVSIKRNSNRHVGFFGFVGTTGIIQNLNIEGSVTNTMAFINIDNSINTGGIVGANTGAVINCSFKGNVTSNNIFHTGGIVGINQDGLVAGCSYIGSEGAMVHNDGVTSGYSGGIVGYNLAGTKNAYILGCFNTGKISANSRCGGIVAENFGFDGTYSAIIVGCYNQGYVKSDDSAVEVGGIAGAFGENSQIIGCYNSGSVLCDDPSNEYVCAIMGSVAFPHEKNQLDTNYWLIDSAPKGYSNKMENQVIDCVEKSASELNSKETVDALNAAIDEWNAANGNLCNYKFAVGSQYPKLVSK